MKKIVFVLLAFSISLSAQESVVDSLEIQNLEEVIVSSVRVKDNIPIAFNNVSKEEISKRNLGQDIPILLNFLPNVVTTSDAGAGIGYTGIRIRGINSQSTNVTINGIPYNDAESLGTFWVDLPDFSSSVENLQVQRGIGTSVNGSSAFGASINILTDKISQNPYFESSNTVGSFNTIKNNFIENMIDTSSVDEDDGSGPGEIVQDEVNYKKMPVKELRELVVQKGLMEDPSKVKKAELLKLFSS